jgi:molybdenum cofactor biosynthesis enzyme
MEALCGLNVALLTIWDLTKPVNAALEITDIKLLYKSGGKRGVWTHPGGLPPAAQAILDTH